MSFNSDSVLEELDALETSESKDRDLSPALEEYLTRIAKTGNIVFPWCKLKPLLKSKINQVLAEFCKNCPTDTIPSLPNTEPFNYEVLKNNILEAVESFESAPFTIQRVCELLTNPNKHYYRTDKYMRGLEKNLLVVTTVDSKSADAVEQETAKNQPAMVNGISADTMNNEHSYDHCAANDLQPVNGTGTVLENFATVFPSAPHISNQPNNIQVAIVSGTDTYQATQSISTFTYCTDSGDEGFHDASESPMTTYDTNGPAYCESETGDKYIVIEELNAPEMNCETEDGGFEDSTAETSINQGPTTTCSKDETTTDDIADNFVDEKEEQEPDRKRRKFEVDPPENNESDSSAIQADDDSRVTVVTEDCGSNSVDTCEPCAVKEESVPEPSVESAQDESTVKTEGTE